MGLVIGRKPGESIVINGPAVVTLERIRGNYAKLHIVADPDVNIRRLELPVADSLDERRTDKF